MRRWIWATIVVAVAVIAVVGWHWRLAVRQVTQTIEQAVAPQPTVRFAVVGDNHGVNPIYRQILRDIQGQDYAFLLNLADATENGTVEEFQAVRQAESALPFPVYHTVGNHDIKTDKTRASFTAAFGQSRWYAVDREQLHLIILDNGDRRVGFPPEELDWLEADLTQHQSQTSVVAYHRPFGLPLAAVLGDDETSASAKTNERLTAILSRSDVRQVFTAHLHTYLPYTVAGIPAVVSGGGGDPAQLVLGGAKNNYFHYLDVTVKGTDVRITPIPVSLRTTGE